MKIGFVKSEDLSTENLTAEGNLPPDDGLLRDLQEGLSWVYGEKAKETRAEQAARLLDTALHRMLDEGGATDLTREMRDCADNLLQEDQYDAVVTVLTRMSGKPSRLVKRALKSKLGVTS